MVAPESNLANIQSASVMHRVPNNPPSNQPPSSYFARPDNTAVNIQWGRPISRASVGGPQSPSPSPMDSSAPSDMDYAERVAIQNNMDVDETTIKDPQSQEPHEESMQPPISAPTHLCSPSEAVPINTLEKDPLFQLLPPDVILYSANILADLSLWDGNFGVISLFGTNEFLQSDVNNMAISLQCMATFLRQRKLENCSGNNIQQLHSFGKAVWSFISAIYKSGWDHLNITDKISFRTIVKSKFTKNVPQPPSDFKATSWQYNQECLFTSPTLSYQGTA